jgi:hypothetical protein
MTYYLFTSKAGFFLLLFDERVLNVDKYTKLDGDDKLQFRYFAF